MSDMHEIAHRILTHDYPAAKKRAEAAEARVAELEARMRKACALMNNHVSCDESGGQLAHESALYALLNLDP